jgi:hypothetical protein
VPFPRRSSEFPGTGCEGQSLGDVSARPYQPRHGLHFRHPRRTQKSVRPAACRVSDRTMVRLGATQTLAHVPRRSEPNKGTMQKKNARTRKQDSASSTETSGLIAKGQKPPRSAGAKPTLDDRSHRTISLHERCPPPNHPYYGVMRATRPSAAYRSNTSMSCPGTTRRGSPARAIMRSRAATFAARSAGVKVAPGVRVSRLR